MCPFFPLSLACQREEERRQKAKKVEERSEKVYNLLPLIFPFTLEHREATRDLMKRNQIQKLSEEAILGVAKKGEPLDPELLNPARKRPPTQVTRGDDPVF